MLLYGNNSNKLKTALNFCKIILTSDEDGEKKTHLENVCDSFSHPDLHFIFPIPSSAKTNQNSCDFFSDAWRSFLLSSTDKLTMNNWKNKLECGNKQPFIGVGAVEPLARKLSLTAFKKSSLLLNKDFKESNSKCLSDRSFFNSSTGTSLI